MRSGILVALSRAFAVTKRNESRFFGEGYTPTARRQKPRDRAGSASTAGGCIFLILQAIRESRGMALSVSDETMLAEIPPSAKAKEFFSARKTQLASRRSGGCSKTGIKATDEVVIFNTVSGLNIWTCFRSW